MDTVTAEPLSEFKPVSLPTNIPPLNQNELSNEENQSLVSGEKESSNKDELDSTHGDEDPRASSPIESEGPVIVIESTSSETTEEDVLERFPFKVRNQRLNLISISDSYSAVSSSTEPTSEGGDSDGKRRSLSPTSNEAIKVFLEETFSDEGLAKDLFLLKHVNRHRHGFVSLKLLTAYKQAKKLNCDWRALSDAAKQSKLLEVDANGRKVRRMSPLPADLRSIPLSRAVAAVDIQEDLCSMDKLAAVFGKYGSVSSLHLLKHKPGGKVPEELQSLAARVPEVAHNTCAIVQYEDVLAAGKVMREFSHPTTSLHVLMQRKKSNRSTPSSRGPSSPIHSNPRVPPFSNSTDKNRSSSSDWRKRITNETRRDSTGSEAEEFVRPRKHSGHSTRRAKTPQPQNKKFSGSNNTSSLPNSPLISRRHRDGITREPKGPDGTKGFSISGKTLT